MLRQIVRIGQSQAKMQRHKVQLFLLYFQMFLLLTNTDTEIERLINVGGKTAFLHFIAWPDAFFSGSNYLMNKKWPQKV